MLTITQTAAQAIDSLVASAPDVPETGGLRIAQRQAPDGSEGFGLSIVEAPETDDQVIDGPNSSVFLEPETAAQLDDKVLDASIEGDRVGFVLTEQSEGAREARGRVLRRQPWEGSSEGKPGSQSPGSSGSTPSG